MTEAADTGRGTPWHFWLVVAIAVLWNGFGGYDYFMSNTAGDSYLRQMGMTDPQIAHFTAMPMWTTAAWALGVWGAVAGTILLLLRSRWAFHAFLASLAGLVASLVYTHLLSNGGAVMGSQGAIMNGVIFAGCVAFIAYARLMVKQGVLR